jgi:anti-sigma regulatory factor (Ser/Thr protein kinase)
VLSWKITLHFECDPRVFPAIRKAMGALSQGLGGTDADAFAIQVAVGEILANAYEHAYEKKAGPVDLDVMKAETGIHVTITNYGLSPPQGLTIPKTSGTEKPRGLYLVGQLMDQVEVIYPVSNGSGMAIRMVKAINASSRQA